MIRLQNKTPQTYVENSRDFQLFCRLYDCVNNSIKFDIDTIPNILDPFLANDRILNLLCTRVGFFPKREYESNVLRHIIEAFPYIIKNKGSKKGIEGAVTTILKVEGQLSNFDIIVDKNEVQIFTTSTIQNKQALDELLEYVLPIGYTYSLMQFERRPSTSELLTHLKLNILTTPTSSLTQVRGTDRIYNTKEKNEFNFSSELQSKSMNTIGVGQVIGSINYTEENTYGKDRLSTTRNKIDSNKNYIEREIKEGE